MTHVTCRLTAKIRDQLRNHTLGNRVWATFRLQRTSQHAATRTRLASVCLSVCLSVRRHHQTLTCRACRRSRWCRSHSPLLARPPCCHRTSSLARAGTCCVSRPPTPATLPHESTCTPSKQVQHGRCGTDSSPHRCRQVANSTEYGGTATADKAWTYPCRQGFLCRCIASMQHAADTAEAAAVNQQFSSPTEKKSFTTSLPIRTPGHGLVTVL